MYTSFNLICFSKCNYGMKTNTLIISLRYEIKEFDYAIWCNLFTPKIKPNMHSLSDTLG